MKLPPEVLQNTILAMFATRGLGHGEMVWLSRFEEFWAQLRLRRADLLDGLADVCTSGWLDLEEHGGKTTLALSPDGEKRARKLYDGGLRDVDCYVREQILATMRFQEEQPRKPGAGRRWHEVGNGSFVS
jgi:hypothetical protein